MALSITSTALSRVAVPCSVCHGFQLRKLRYGDQIRYAADFSPMSLLQSALTCPFCAIVLGGVLKLGGHDIETLESVIAWIYIRGPHELPPLTLSVEIYYRDSRPKLELEIYAEGSSGSTSSFGVVARSTKVFQPTEPLAASSVQWARSNISNCLSRHTKCSKSTKTALPSRVLSCKKTVEGKIDVLLRETDNSLGEYACISHRWGGSASGKTTRDTYPDFLHGIAWDAIPPTFQDIIRFSLALGIENIWIDSYCIIQDDADDWGQQAGQMANIYRNSSITLAATASTDNESGCFWSANDAYEKRFETGLGSFTVRKTMRHWERSWNANTAFPLLSRAWVFQERLLAPRVLHFSHHELVWECMELGDCQCGGYYLPSNPKIRDWGDKASWTSAVELYSALDLTVAQDRLPALLGFASFFAQSNGASLEKDYVAGLWMKSIKRDLLWRVNSSALASGAEPDRICYCFDSAYSSDKNWRCQYSYSAACSLPCLDRRRLCRHGTREAAVPYDVPFLAACSGGGSTTTIQDLLSMRAADPLRRSKDAYTGPSWSWASAQGRVQYWQDLPKNASRDALTVASVSVQRDKRVLTGPISYARLLVSGRVTPALLRYVDLPDPSTRWSAVRHHDIFNYSLEININQRRLEFFPDYIISMEGRGWIPPFTSVFLLYVDFGAYLVLKEKDFFDLPREGRLKNLATGMNPAGSRQLMDVHAEYVRVGILRLPDNTTIVHRNTDWLIGIQIV
ncbi:uncharacterized protein JN550_010907 [Neoarthrinium moseri]|uniref:uncharacterized protein n=1 Tax=Neoarthrinium moseri TaxID=1658444 RepID=UPI001FDDD353|nr:uncharacterized protein JN550_010907 [Neoarthrinium moseri]KAI1861377.1 hypothetical protein JN550_010907 [Neoarthrinium moseri]